MGMKLILLGAPGAGKGTQAEILSAKLGIPTISTGNILRAAIKEETPTGLEAKSYMDAGKLVPDSVIIGIVADRLAQPDCARGFILDGVPRTIGQAEAIDRAGITFDRVLSIEISDGEIEERMSGRRVCQSCGAPYHVKARPPQGGGGVRLLRRTSGPAGGRPGRDRPGAAGGLPSGDRTPEGLLRGQRHPGLRGQSGHH